MPSVWTLVGDEARTAFTVYVFQVSTASGGTTIGLCDLADAACSDAVAASATTSARTGSALIRKVHRFMSPPIRAAGRIDSPLPLVLSPYGICRTLEGVRSLGERDAAALAALTAELAVLEDAEPFPPHFLGRLAELMASRDAGYCELDRSRERTLFIAWWEDGRGGSDVPVEEGPEGEAYWRLRHQHPT